jgi:DNA mismatch repair protein MutL
VEDRREGSRSRVRLLPDRLVDQIAAGEVVERPASVVKELVENALDAGAGRIRIDVREGGAALVAVSDDGYGMDPEDARLALERHATSKIGSVEDLAGIQTFGFRGEALPAIASVSTLRLRTRARGAPEGVELRVEGGKLVDARAAGGPEGTRVEVARLFENVPARRKFLKKPGTEWGHVADWLARAALATPEVHFDVRRDERPAVSWPAASERLDRIAAVLSDREAEGLVPVAASGGDFRIAGYASRPDAHRPNAAGIYLFVNGRPVRDRLLRHALLEVYRDVLPRGRFPTALLYLEVPAGSVDVNVHPAKWEVRFAEPAAVHALVARGVREALGQRRWLGEPARAPVRVAPAPAAADDWSFAGSREGAGNGGGAQPLRLRESPTPELPARPTEERLVLAGLPLLGQLLATYLLLETADGLLLVDQHAAHERVLYERFRGAWRTGGAPRQPLLLPETVELAPADVARLGESAAELERIGFELEPFGATAVAVRAIPALLAGRDPGGLIRELGDELARHPFGDRQGEGGRAPEEADRLFASLACHAARRAGERLDPREQRALLEALDAIPWAPTCPHGRPVAIPLSRGEIERRFGRA